MADFFTVDELKIVLNPQARKQLESFIKTQKAKEILNSNAVWVYNNVKNMLPYNANPRRKAKQDHMKNRFEWNYYDFKGEPRVVIKFRGMSKKSPRNYPQVQLWGSRKQGYRKENAYGTDWNSTPQKIAKKNNFNAKAGRIIKLNNGLPQHDTLQQHARIAERNIMHKTLEAYKNHIENKDKEPMGD
ncbi:hypothetical protein [Mycoplasma seminis]|uniref:Uncharacterized protein n=1 Tax=Mycoplasma seminis TaxID=512749 RepID=A0ABY9H9T0_9MOLU|nr:hypothetical protein [Mycoplasma seminis]WLP85287.1 hypothetical protein Q8852_03110 [Mycoplasma seminis]